ncbi:MAG: hypothetical protein IPI40_16230 [Betaproteobacteria bacterium]|nr:hypothetical protein [Betaproteobacteria bacterium]
MFDGGAIRLAHHDHRQPDMLNARPCERARAGATDPCPTRLSWRQGDASPAAAMPLSPQARTWIAGVPWYEACVAHAWAHRAAAPGAAAADLLESVEAVRRCCECLLWSDSA